VFEDGLESGHDSWAINSAGSTRARLKGAILVVSNAREEGRIRGAHVPAVHREAAASAWVMAGIE
jgi:hypothetical protein